MTVKRIEIPYQSLATYLSILKSCHTEARIHVTKNKISTSEVDCASVCIVNVGSECKTTGHPFVFGIDVALLQKVIKFAKGCNITLDIAEEKILVKYGRFKSKIDILEESTIRKDPNPPNIYLPISFEAPGKYLNEVLAVCNSSSYRSVFSTKNGVVSFCAIGDSFCIKEIIAETESKDVVKSMFSNDYLKDIVNTVKDVSLKIDIGIDHPARIYAEKDDCKVTFLLAPRIESDD